jgi:galactonate dehydratase
MKVAEVETFVVGNPPPAFGGRYFVFVKVTTDDGIIGYGEESAATFRADIIAAGIEDLADHFLIGHDPLHVERFWRRAYGRGFTNRPDVTLQAAMSALEIAC